MIRQLHALAVLSAALVLSAAWAPSALASKDQWSLFEDHLYLVNSGDATREQKLDEIKRLGADTIRVEVKWSEVAPSPKSTRRPAFDARDPAAYPGFGPYDDLIRRATAKGFRILVSVTGDTPRWAKGGSGGPNQKPNAEEFGKFVSAVGLRYSGTFGDLPEMDYWSIWNEPNHINFLKPSSRAARIYRSLVDAAIPALRRNGHADSHIFVGELAPTPRRGIGPLRFLRRWLCLDDGYQRLRGDAARRAGCTNFKKIDADGFADHPYGPTKAVPPYKDIINILAIRRLAAALDRAARAGRIPYNLPIYNTEFGYQSNPPDLFVSTSPARQARLLNEKELFSYNYPRLKSYAQYLLHDDKARPGPPLLRWSGFQTGLRFADGGIKPAYQAYKFPIVVRKRGRGVVIWGRVRPGSGVRSVQIQRKSGGRFTDAGPRVRTDDRGYFTVRRSSPGSYRFLAFDGSGSDGGSGAGRTPMGSSRTATPSG